MLIYELRNKFVTLKDYEPTNDELLDFARQNYLHGVLDILEFRNLIYTLEKAGAQFPEFPNEESSDPLLVIEKD